MARSREGFVLPAVLVVTGVVTLIFVVALTALAAMTREAMDARERVAFLERALTAEAVTAFLVTTEPMTSQGIAPGASRADDSRPGAMSAPDEAPETSERIQTVIRLDGRPYDDKNLRLVIRLQDQAGLLNIATLDPYAWRRFIGALGLPEGSAEAWRDRLDDYVDSDSLRRPDGAEAGDYPYGGPANRHLVRPSEWLSVLGVRDAVGVRRWRSVSRFVTYDERTFSFNPNTAPPFVLITYFGMSEEQASRIMVARENRSFETLEEMLAAGGVSYAGDSLATFPNGRILFEFSDENSRWAYFGRMRFTPSHAERPIWIDRTEIRQLDRRASPGQTDSDEFPYAPN